MTPFGEFLVEQRVIDRFQLFRALQLQDRVPGARLGQCAVALGYAPRTAIEQLYTRFALEHMPTEAFQRIELEGFDDCEIEVTFS